MTVECLLILCLARPEPPPVPEPWNALADCESDHTWDANTGNGYRGGLQFHPDTWDGFRPDHFPEDAHLASPQEEIAVAERVLDVQGWEAWPACSRKLGLRE